MRVPIAQPRFIATNGRWLFAWHHPPSAATCRRAGVVLCPPLGYEYMSAYPTIRVLAERLAALGFDVLRIDYDGTGNSSGDFEDPDRVGAWVRSVASAIAEMRKLTRSSLVALVGLRAGALLALEAAAATGGVQRLVLWNPFASGHAYVRELQALAGLSRQDHALDEADEPGINAAGHPLTKETVEALDGWTLDAIRTRPAEEILVVEGDDRPGTPIVEVHLEKLGARVTSIRPSGTAAMFALPHVAKVPEEVLLEVTNWFGRWRVPAVRMAGSENHGRCDSAPSAGGRYRERAVRFGRGNRLFGIVDSPAAGASASNAVILLNTGAEYHVGPHRMYVPLAREWAASGLLVLRFDLGGIGDSPTPAGAADNVACPAHMLDDLRDAIALVRHEAPHGQVTVAGLCSGGWLAFQGARDGLDIDAIVSVNPPLYLRDGAAGAEWLSAGNEFERYQRSMRDRSKWLKALRGGASYRTFARVAAGALGRRVAVGVTGVLGDALPDGLARDLCNIASRGIKSLFVFSERDNGFEYFRVHAKPALRRAHVQQLIESVVIEGAGHSFRPRSAQQTLRQLLTDFVAAPATSMAEAAARHDLR